MITPDQYKPTQVNLILDLKPGMWFIANIIGKGIYEMVENGINHTGSKYATVRCKKLFCLGVENRNHETTCHPIECYTWNNLKRLNRKTMTPQTNTEYKVGDIVIIKSTFRFKLLAIDNKKGIVISINKRIKVLLDCGIICWPRPETINHI